MNNNVSFRPGEPSMCSDASVLIYQSSHELLDFMFSNKTIAEKVLRELYKKKRGHFGCQFSTIALLDSKVVGIELGYDKDQLSKQALIGSVLLMLASPLSIWWHLAATVGSVVDNYVPAPGGGTYYINNIAVSPECRGQGIGKLLVMDTINRSTEAGYKAVELDVTAVNESAVRFYEKNGFIKVSESGDQQLFERYGLPPLIRMVRKL